MGDLVDEINSRCKSNNCVDTSLEFIKIFKESGYKESNSSYEEFDNSINNFFYVSLTIKENNRTYLHHSFILRKVNPNLYRYDSWEGIYPFDMKKIHTSWFEDLIRYLHHINNTGEILYSKFEELFGKRQWFYINKEEYVNDYPKDKVLSKPLIELKILKIEN